MGNIINQIGKSGIDTIVQTLPNNAPVYITLNYDKIRTLQFPVNPEEIKRVFDSSHLSKDIESVGEIAIPQQPKLSTISISSFFWGSADLTPPMAYVNWIRTWQNSKKPATLIITRFNFSMNVICTHFDYSIRAGEEGDIYFTLDLKEYRSYGAKKITMRNILLQNNVPSSIFSAISNALNEATSYIAIPILPTVKSVIRRINERIPLYSNDGKYKVKKDSTVASITRDLTGSTKEWKLLYDANKNVLDDNFDVSVGTELVIPDEWLKSGIAEIRG